FLAVLAHELRNALAPIRYAAAALQLREPVDEITRSARDLIDRQVNDAMRFVEDLLDTSRITTGKLILEKKPVQLDLALSTAIECSRPMMEARKHHFEMKMTEELPLWIEGDLTWLSHVFANILNNAAKYTPPGGRIELVTAATPREAVVR